MPHYTGQEDEMGEKFLLSVLVSYPFLPDIYHSYYTLLTCHIWPPLSLNLKYIRIKYNQNHKTTVFRQLLQRRSPHKRISHGHTPNLIPIATIPHNKFIERYHY